MSTVDDVVKKSGGDFDDLAKALLSWHDPADRRLAWRAVAAPDRPWGVLLSEVLSQQTQAERAAEAWERFVTIWPYPETMAAAPLAAVITAWQGLGYNRRAVNLHRSSVAITTEHGGVVPNNRQALLALPGIGPYTASAILAFGYDHDVIAIDTNAGRILARIVGHPLNKKTTEETARLLLERTVSSPSGRSQGAALTEALMDLGSGICTSRKVHCDRCPVTVWCAWNGGNDTVLDPAMQSAHRPTPQGKFEGSVRQRRGKLMDLLRKGPTTLEQATEVVGDDAAKLLDRLTRDGLAEERRGTFYLPGWSGEIS